MSNWLGVNNVYRIKYTLRQIFPSVNKSEIQIVFFKLNRNWKSEHIEDISRQRSTILFGLFKIIGLSRSTHFSAPDISLPIFLIPLSPVIFHYNQKGNNLLISVFHFKTFYLSLPVHK